MFKDASESDVPVPDALDLVLEADFQIAHGVAVRMLRIDALRQEHLADAENAGRRFTDVVMRGLRLEVASAIRVTEHVAGDLIARAEALIHRYPAAFDALWAGNITEKHSEILVDSLDELEPDLRGEVSAQALALAVAKPVGSFRRALKKLIETVRVLTLAERHEKALANRRVFVEYVHDGMAWTHLFGPAVEAHAAFERVTAIAGIIHAQDGEARTLDQLRADVMGDLVIDGTTDTHPVAARGIRATVVVTVPVLALLENDDAGVAARGMDPATVEGIGPVPLARAKELCGGDEKWMRVLTHPETGMVLSVGRDQYSPPASLKRLVKWRAGRCMAPGCGIPATRCEIDHNLAWSDGGCTQLHNHCPFCRGHHHVKHHGGWEVKQIPGSGGVIQWTSPTGRVYLVEPERRVPVFTVRRPDEGTPPF